MVQKSMPLEELKKLNPGAIASIDLLPRELGRKESELGFLPLRIRRAFATVIVAVFPVPVAPMTATCKRPVAPGCAPLSAA